MTPIQLSDPFRFSAKNFGLPFLLSFMLGLAGLPASAQVTIQIVNDSGLPDTNVFIKVPGKLFDNDPAHVPVTPTNLFADINAASPPNPDSLALSDLTPVAPLVSSISGATNTIYSFQADYIASGSIYFTYRQPFSFTNGLQPSPPPDSAGNAWRYDYAEFSINDTNAANNAMDITYVDKFGIPLQMEWFHGTNLVAGSYVYASTKTLADLFASNQLAAAVFSLASNNIASGWHYAGPDSYTNFARILAPQKVSGTNASVAPYPDIGGYLNSLVGDAHAFALNGASGQGGYYYAGYRVTVDTNASGWNFTLAYDASSVPPFDASLLSAGNLPYTNTITFAVTTNNASQYIYGAPVGPNLYLTNGVLVTTNTSPTYNVETWMIGDVLSALNYGFWGGQYGADSRQWYSTMEWTSYPFGWARATADGDYNPYAALIYYCSDPYSFAFSERITPDVLMAPTNGDTVRITLLPDDRLDSPVVSAPANLITDDAITLNWNPVPGATGYQVNVLRPPGFAPVIISSNSYTLSGLDSGAPYVMAVQALGAAHGNPIITPARPVAAATLGLANASHGDFAQVQVTFSAADTYYQIGQVSINGTELVSTGGQWLTTNNVPARWLASVGTNQVIVKVTGANNEVFFNDWLTFVLAPPFTVTNGMTVTTNSAISEVVLNGQKLGQPAPGVSGFLNGTTATNFLVSTLNPCLSIGLSYVPAETRKFAPAQTATAPVIVNVAGLPSGGIRFSYDVPANAPYVIESSSDLITWQTNFNGLGEAGTESYTNDAGTNALRFYRIKL